MAVRWLFATLVALLLATCSTRSAQGELVHDYTPAATAVPTERDISLDGAAYVTDIVHVPLTGPSIDLVDDGSRQTLAIDLAPLEIFVIAKARYFWFDLFLPDATFPVGTGPFTFFPADSLDRLVLEGEALAVNNVRLNLQEYNESLPGPIVRT